MKFCQFVMGPAGSGKSTFCSTMLTHLKTLKRSVHLVNLDPAAEHFDYEPTIDIQNLISLQDVMDELKFGPNGGLIYALEYLVSNMDWLEDELSDFDDDYLIIDCPGQIELYTHIPVMRDLVQAMTRLDYRVCAVYLLDAQFMDDPPKFFSGVMTAMSAMVQLEVPHINILSKMDLIEGDGEARSRRVERFLETDPSLLLEDLNATTSPKFAALNEALLRLIDDFNLVSFIPLNITDEDSVAVTLQHIDHAMQYGEDVEPKEVRDDDMNESGGSPE